MQIQKFQRKPFSVEGVRVTDENIAEVADWCLGEVQTNEKSGVKHIRVDAHRPLTERQTMAFVGDWVLFHNRGFKVYTESAFSRNFELIEAGTGSEHADFVPEDSQQTMLPIDMVEVARTIKSAAEKMADAVKQFQDGSPDRP